ncbi:GNAT family N-acetyltransferase [Chitinophaga agrisoli]|uniref:GNAT family N-acetyltransferase n=1 Tax=Chitinophaga agrisoli TaxID=2607653 RepID=A0A5B2VKN9_9BACT|nr:GNAT family N-acetyltransferase [Chitinophaga agrisoli]KAA2239525.1 GNAT family N-acetyltransferase [Chitinophaga agrisoli]
MPNVQLKIAATTRDFEQARILFEEYARSLDFDLSYQDFQQELDGIAQQYKAPEGALLLCFVDNENAVGCAGVRKFADGIAELKRLYVNPDHRSLKIGKQLLEMAIRTAGQLHYEYMRLDTVPGQTKAQELYHYLGFYEIAPYRYSPIKGTIYFEKRLVEI